MKLGPIFGDTRPLLSWSDPTATTGQFPTPPASPPAEVYLEFCDGSRCAVGTASAYAVPLPTTIALLGLGLVGIGDARRKQA